MAAPRYHREKLIDEVRRFPVLYDTQHASHRDNEVRDQCWAKIADALAIDCDTAKREWKILRDSLRQAIKRKRRSSGEAARPWRFQKKMDFIVPHMNLRKPRRVWSSTVSVKPEEDEGSAGSRSPTPPPPPDSDDALELFFASVCHSARRLPRRQQNQLKRRVLDALAAAEEALDDPGGGGGGGGGYQH